MPFAREIELYLRARCTLLVLVTPEEDRAIQAVRVVCEHLRRPCISWDSADHFVSLSAAPDVPPARDPLAALEQIDRAEGDCIFVLRDFHEHWGDARTKRKLRSLAQRLRFSKKSILVTTPSSKLPEELKDDAVLLHLPAPGPAELEVVLDRLARTPGVRFDLTAEEREKIIQAALGLTASQAQRVFAKAIVADGVLDGHDVDLVIEEKRQIIRESEALEYHPATQSMADVGGLASLKKWVRLRERAFTREAHAYGLPAPKGIALLGIPGTGKSLVARMIAGMWRLPLFRLDAGALFGSLIGESEERTRRALRLAEATAPSLLWIDEIEKALAHGGLDSGTSNRVFASILTWIQEKSAPVFIVATANEIARLPPELLRKGRFDDIFFLDLPSQSERQEILTVHLRKRKREPENFDVARLASESEGYVGAELEQSIVDAMYVGFGDNREFTTDDVSAAFRRQIPLAVSQRETIAALRTWLSEGRAQSAS